MDRSKDIASKLSRYIEKLAKHYEFTLPNRGYDIYGFANDIMIYLTESLKNSNKHIMKTPVNIVRNEEGMPVGVSVATLDESFILDLFHINGGQDYPWTEAIEKLKLQEKSGFTAKQCLIVGVYRNEINALLKEAGGDPLDWEWSAEEINETRAYSIDPYDLTTNTSKCISRPIRAVKNCETCLEMPDEKLPISKQALINYLDAKVPEVLTSAIVLLGDEDGCYAYSNGKAENLVKTLFVLAQDIPDIVIIFRTFIKLWDDGVRIEAIDGSEKEEEND